MSTELKVSNQLRGFARRLVAEGLIEEQAALEACDAASKKGLTVLAWLTRDGKLDPAVLASAASVEYGVPLLDANSLDLAHAPISLVSESLVHKHKALPLYLRGNSLFLAISDPTDNTVIDEISFSSGFHV